MTHDAHAAIARAHLDTASRSSGEYASGYADQASAAALMAIYELLKERLPAPGAPQSTDVTDTTRIVRPLQTPHQTYPQS